MGKLDNTLIIYISDDNGTSAKGTTVGTPNQMTAYNGRGCGSDAEQIAIIATTKARAARQNSLLDFLSSKHVPPTDAPHCTLKTCSSIHG
jgi:hypothetical protein